MTNFDKIVDAGKSFACSIYRTQPGALIPNPINDVLRLVWDNLCADDPGGLPVPPTQPFTGGQCVCLVYVVDVVLSDGTGFGNNLYGPIRGCRVVYTPRVNGLFDADIQVLCRGSFDNGFSPCQPSEVWTRLAFQPNIPDLGQGQIVNVSVRGGGPDTCGNPPISYPVVDPPPVGGYVSPPTNITYNDGTDFTTIFNLQPPSNADNGPPDICLSVSIKGIEFEVCFPFDSLPRLGGGGGDDNLEELVRDLQDEVLSLRERVDELLDPPNPESDPSLSPVVMPGEGGGVEDDLPGLKWVVVSLTTLPVKAQFGTPSVQFAGWITFKVGSEFVNRQPIEFERGVFQAPPGSSGYGITFTNKAAGTSTAYVQSATP